MTSVRPVSDIASDLLVAAGHGGGTVPAIQGQLVPSSGYAVGGRVPTVIIDVTEPNISYAVREAVTAFVRRYVHASVWHRSFFGVWVDRGELFLDVVDVLSGLQDALSLASARNETAIYDFSKSEDAYL